jgi:ATP-dependent DNA ligase
MGAFDLIELNGDDLRREPLQVRKATLASALIKAARVCASTSITKLTGRPCMPTLAKWALRASVAGLAQVEEPGERGGAAGGGGRLGK